MKKLLTRRSLLAASPAIILTRPVLAQVGQIASWPPKVPFVSTGVPTTFDPANKSAGMVLSFGNLVATAGAGDVYDYARSIASHSSGKYYWEITIQATNGGGNNVVGIGNASGAVYTGGASFPGSDANSGATFDNNTGFYVSGASLGQCLPTALTTGDVVGVALDAGGKLIWLRKNSGNWNNSGTANPATGTGGFSIAGITGPYFAYVWLSASQHYAANFGGSTFSMTAPSSFGNM